MWRQSLAFRTAAADLPEVQGEPRQGRSLWPPGDSGQSRTLPDAIRSDHAAAEGRGCLRGRAHEGGWLPRTALRRPSAAANSSAERRVSAPGELHRCSRSPSGGSGLRKRDTVPGLPPNAHASPVSSFDRESQNATGKGDVNFNQTQRIFNRATIRNQTRPTPNGVRSSTRSWTPSK